MLAERLSYKLMKYIYIIVIGSIRAVVEDIRRYTLLYSLLIFLKWPLWAIDCKGFNAYKWVSYLRKNILITVSKVLS